MTESLSSIHRDGHRMATCLSYYMSWNVRRSDGEPLHCFKEGFVIHQVGLWKSAGVIRRQRPLGMLSFYPCGGRLLKEQSPAELLDNPA